MIGIVSQIKSTVVPQVLQRTEFWVLMALCGLSTYAHIADLVSHEYTIPPAVLHPIQALMVFCLVFYTNQCFGRYFKLYGTTRDMMGVMQELVSECKIRLQDVSVQRKVVNYTLAGIFGFFFEASNGELLEENLQEIQSRGLLNTTEIAFLRRYPPKLKSFVCLQWACEAAKFGLGKDGLRYVQLITAKVMFLRRSQQDVSDTMKMPLPFQYFHIMNLMLLVNLGLLSFTLGSYQNYSVVPVFGFVEMIFMGIREMAVAMSDPFGDDDVDFPVAAWLDEVLECSRGLLESDFKVGTKENCYNVMPLTNEACDGMDLAFYETRKQMIQRYCSGLKKSSNSTGFNTPHEDLRARKSKEPVKASRGKLVDEEEDEDLLGGKRRSILGFGGKKPKAKAAPGGRKGSSTTTKADEDDGDE